MHHYQPIVLYTRRFTLMEHYSKDLKDSFNNFLKLWQEEVNDNEALHVTSSMVSFSNDENVTNIPIQTILQGTLDESMIARCLKDLDRFTSDIIDFPNYVNQPEETKLNTLVRIIVNKDFRTST